MDDQHVIDVFAEADKFFDDSSKTDGNPRFVLITGSAAAGKTTLRKLHFTKGYVLLDAGQIFLNLSRGGHYDFPDAFLEPLDIIGHLVAARAITERRNIVTEMIGVNLQSIKTLLEALIALGYETEGQLVKCDGAERVRRNENRSPDNISAYYTEPFHQRWLLEATKSRTEPETREAESPSDISKFFYDDDEREIIVGGRRTSMRQMWEEGRETARAKTEREHDADLKGMGLKKDLIGGEWDEDSFLEKLRQQKGDEMAQTAITLRRWLEDRGYSIYWAQAGKTGSFSAYVNTASKEIMRRSTLRTSSLEAKRLPIRLNASNCATV
jgi:hypothetical protein